MHSIFRDKSPFAELRSTMSKTMKLVAGISALMALGVALLLKFPPPSKKGELIQARLAEPPKGTLKTIKVDNGDIIDCVDIYKQPAFDHPLLRDHILQMNPSSYSSEREPTDGQCRELLQVWNKHEQCPNGAIPIKRQIITGYPVIRRKFDSTIQTSDINNHQYATTRYRPGAATMKGTRALITVWDPSLVNFNKDFSLSQIWVQAGNDPVLNTVEAGWQVYPNRTNDTNPRLFIYWTSDSYQLHGCYDLTCPGFVQTNANVVIGSALTPSTYNTQLQELEVAIHKDARTNAWWLSVGGTAVGYWPETLFVALRDGADTITWGGEIFDSSGSGGFHTLTQMGSGHLAGEGYRKASHVRGFMYYNSNGQAVSLTQNDLDEYAPAPDCYNYSYQTLSSELHFFNGGPGCN